VSNKSPAFQFYPADYLADFRVSQLTLAEEGIYIRLLCHLWLTLYLPSDTKSLLRCVGKGIKVASLKNVLKLFVLSDDGTHYTHKRLDKERLKQSEYRKKKQEAGRLGGKQKAENSSTANLLLVAKPSSISSTISTTSISKENITKEKVADAPVGETKKRVRKPFIKPTAKEVTKHAKEVHGYDLKGETFIAYYESNGWMIGKVKMKSWKNAVGGTWKENHKKSHAKNRPTSAHNSKANSNFDQYAGPSNNPNITRFS